MKTKQLPTQERLKEVLNYDHETGVFTWKISRGVKKGTEAGCLTGDGYILIRVDRKLYRASRIAWMYHYGEDPGDLLVDHKDRNRSSNRIDNLRLATPEQNNQNMNANGFSWSKARKKWEAYIRFEGRKINLGLFTCTEDAREAYINARHKYFGEFA